MIDKIRDEDLVGARVQGHAIQAGAQTAHTNHRRRVQHAQDGAVHGQHLHAMFVSDYQRPSTCYRHGQGVDELPRLRASRAQVLPHSTVDQTPQGQPMVPAISHHDHGTFLLGQANTNRIGIFWNKITDK